MSPAIVVITQTVSNLQHSTYTIYQITYIVFKSCQCFVCLNLIPELESESPNTFAKILWTLLLSGNYYMRIHKSSLTRPSPSPINCGTFLDPPTFSCYCRPLHSLDEIIFCPLQNWQNVPAFGYQRSWACVHSISVIQCSGKNIRFIVMNNLLPSSIKMHEKYDLKGSTYKRKASRQERSKSSPTLKDLDFRELHVKGLLLEEETLSALLKTMDRDGRVSK